MPDLRRHADPKLFCKIISDQRLLCYHIAGMATDLLTRCLNIDIAQFSVARTNSKANNIHIAQLRWNHVDLTVIVDSFQQRFTQAIFSLKNHNRNLIEQIYQRIKKSMMRCNILYMLYRPTFSRKQTSPI